MPYSSLCRSVLYPVLAYAFLSYLVLLLSHSRLLPLLACVFLVSAFLACVFLVCAFLACVFLAYVFLAYVFLAYVFLAYVLLGCVFWLLSFTFVSVCHKTVSTEQFKLYYILDGVFLNMAIFLNFNSF